MDAPVQDVCENQLEGDLKSIVEGIATREGFTDFNLEVSRASAKGDNYVGVLFRARITGRRSDKDGDGMSLIVKCPSEDKGMRNHLSHFFENEAYMYGEVLPAFVSLQEEVGVPGEQQFGGVARWHGTDKSDDGISIVLEDMSTRGYRLGDRLEGLDAAHCSLVIKELARLHALSFAMRDQHPEDFQNLRSRVKDTAFRSGDPNDRMRNVFQMMTKFTSSILRKKFAPDSIYMTCFQDFCSGLMESMGDLVQGEAVEPYAVICHGDCWTNNYLFKYSEDGKTPVSVCLIDFQVSRYSSPIVDLAYFLHSSTEGNVRREAYISLLEDYYNSLSQFLRMLGSDPEKLFPYSVFKEHEKKFSKFGLVMSVIAMHIFTAPADYEFDMGNDLAVNRSILEKRSSEDRLIRRLSDVVVDMVDNNFI